MAQYTQQDRTTLINWFPGLKEDAKFRITSDCTPAYNCIGWALGMNDVWVGLDHPSNYAWNWWPKEVAENASQSSLISLFAYFGFVECEDGKIEENFDKVALYANNSGWTHAARIVAEDELHSKIGTAWDIHHGTTSLSVNSDYGSIFAYMKRPISDRYLTDIKRPITGKVLITE